MNKVVWTASLLASFILGAIVSAAIIASGRLEDKREGYTQISGQTYKLVPVEIKYVEITNESDR